MEVLSALEPEARKLGEVQFQLGACVLHSDPMRAEGHFAAAGAAEPPHPEARVQWVRCLRRRAALTEADEVARVGLASGATAALFAERGNTLKLMGRVREGRAAFEAARGHGDDARIGSDALLCELYVSGEPEGPTTGETRQAHAVYGRSLRHTDVVVAPVRPPDAPLRVGYLSSDFRDHAVAAFVEPVLRAHDRSRVQVFGFADVLRPDTVTERLGTLCEELHQVAHLDDDDLAEVIEGCALDVLVELNGHTGLRLRMLARRLAPVQLSYIGYPHDTGVTSIDGHICDVFTEPEERVRQVRLASCFTCYQPSDVAPEVGVLPAVECGYVTFGSFNNQAKLTPRVLETWAQIVQQVSGARLLLKNPSLEDEGVRELTFGRLENAGLARERVELVGLLKEEAEHLGLYGRVDIALDPFPYNGTTTTCEALWMGVPVVTLAGDSHAARVGVSFLSQLVGDDDPLGMRALIQQDVAGYVAAAVGLAKDRPRLSLMRKGLRDRMRSSPLCDAQSHARALESAYRDAVEAARSRAVAVDAPPAPEVFARRKRARERIAEHPFWYHRIALPDGVTTPGWAPLDVDAYGVPEDLTGMRVLDVGAWDGYWSFEALRRGAREVVAIDDFSDTMGVIEKRDRHAWQTFDLCRELLGHDPKRCQRHELSVYDVTEERLGRFDVVLFFGTLYHLRYPLLGLDRLAAVCDDRIFVESAIADDFSAYRGGMDTGYPDPDQVVAEFYPTTEYGNNDSNWWTPTLACMQALVSAAGFSRELSASKLDASPVTLARCRGFVSGRKPQGYWKKQGYQQKR